MNFESHESHIFQSHIFDGLKAGEACLDYQFLVF